MACRQLQLRNKHEILSKVHQAMRLLTSALEALSFEPDEEEQHPRQMKITPSPAVPTADPARYVVFDFETNGIGKTKNIRICQIGAAALTEDFTVVDVFSHFCNPLALMDDGALAVHGLNEDFVEKFDTWSVVGGNFSKWLDLVRGADQEKPLTLMAHNGKRFDSRILVSENARHGVDLPQNLHHCDTIDVMKILFPSRNSYVLGRVYNDVIGFTMPDAHDAMADVNGVIEILKRGHPRALVNAISAHTESFNHVIKRVAKSK